VPPGELFECEQEDPSSSAALTKSMAEALDTELGRLLGAVDPATWVFFLGDNGTVGPASEPPFLPAHAKGTCFEGGLNVPFVVRGPGVAAGESAALVSAVDLFATICDLAGSPCPAEDSVSLLAHLLGDPTPPRATVYSERFSPNLSAPPHAYRLRAIRDARWKLIQETGEPDRFYDLESDPFERVDLWPPQGEVEQAAYAALEAALPTP
jgi:arylsulfatase A-like enzyme